jgi:hypothetical protein
MTWVEKVRSMKEKGRSFYGFGKVLTTMESWGHSRAAVEPTLLLINLLSMGSPKWCALE